MKTKFWAIVDCALTESLTGLKECRSSKTVPPVEATRCVRKNHDSLGENSSEGGMSEKMYAMIPVGSTPKLGEVFFSNTTWPLPVRLMDRVWSD